MNFENGSPINGLKYGSGQHFDAPPPMYQPSIAPPHASVPMVHHTAPRPNTPSTPKIDVKFVRKYSRICAPIALIISMILSVSLLPWILLAIFRKSGFDDKNADEAVSVMFKIFGGFIGTFGLLTFFCLILAFCKDSPYLLQVYTAYHYLTDTIVLMGIIAFFVLGYGSHFWYLTVLFVIFIIVFFVFTNYTHWQISQLKKALKLGDAMDTVTYEIEHHPRMYNVTAPDYGAPPVYPGNDDPESRPHSRVGNWVQTTYSV